MGVRVELDQIQNQYGLRSNPESVGVFQLKPGIRSNPELFRVTTRTTPTIPDLI